MKDYYTNPYSLDTVSVVKHQLCSILIYFQKVDQDPRV